MQESEMDGGKLSVWRDRCICPVAFPSELYKQSLQASADEEEERRGTGGEHWHLDERKQKSRGNQNEYQHGLI